MAIHKRVRHRTNQMSAAALPTFSYPATDDLATVVIDAWINGPYTYTPTVVPGPVPVPASAGDGAAPRRCAIAAGRRLVTQRLAP